MLSRAHRNFQSNWTAILLAVISIIQGLAFNDLAGRLQTILDYTFATHDLIPAAHFLFSFILLLRIFQTYVTAALDYDEWTANFPDILLIFVIGLLEYHVFSSLTVPGFFVKEFHKRISIVSVLALIGYIRAYASLKEPMFGTYEAYRRELRLQAVNVGGIVAVLSISMVVVLTHSLPNIIYSMVGTLAAAILAFNIGYSLKITFSTRIDTTAISQDATVIIGAQLKNKFDKIEVRQARRGDVLALAQIMSVYFGYIYSATFDTSPRMTGKILLSLLKAASGRIPNFGYRSFQVACSGDSLEVLGLLKCTYTTPINAARTYSLLTPAIILYHLGLTGLVRTWRNWRVLRDTVPEISSNELYVQYIAVNEQFQKSGVGGQLIGYARELCARLGKTKVILDVREPNMSAREFFRSQGFHEDLLINRRSDQVLGKGSTIRMGHSLPATPNIVNCRS